jgi:hypothetical protein
MKSEYCKRPDRHNPKLECGYPRPCPHHAFELDLDREELKVPEGASVEEASKVSAIAAALLAPAKKRRGI